MEDNNGKKWMCVLSGCVGWFLLQVAPELLSLCLLLFSVDSLLELQRLCSKCQPSTRKERVILSVPFRLHQLFKVFCLLLSLFSACALLSQFLYCNYRYFSLKGTFSLTYQLPVLVIKGKGPGPVVSLLEMEVLLHLQGPELRERGQQYFYSPARSHGIPLGCFFMTHCLGGRESILGRKPKVGQFNIMFSIVQHTV